MAPGLPCSGRLGQACLGQCRLSRIQKEQDLGPCEAVGWGPWEAVQAEALWSWGALESGRTPGKLRLGVHRAIQGYQGVSIPPEGMGLPGATGGGMDTQISPAQLGQTLCSVENPPKGPGPQRDVGDLVRKWTGAPGENG